MNIIFVLLLTFAFAQTTEVSSSTEGEVYGTEFWISIGCICFLVFIMLILIIALIILAILKRNRNRRYLPL